MRRTLYSGLRPWSSELVRGLLLLKAFNIVTDRLATKYDIGLYASYPEEVSIVAWEGEFDRANEVDFHRIDQFATVKVGTSSEFFDERTLIVAHTSN